MAVYFLKKICYNNFMEIEIDCFSYHYESNDSKEEKKSSYQIGEEDSLERNIKVTRKKRLLERIFTQYSLAIGGLECILQIIVCAITIAVTLHQLPSSFLLIAIPIIGIILFTSYYSNLYASTTKLRFYLNVCVIVVLIFTFLSYI